MHVYEQTSIFGETDLEFAERTAIKLLKEFEPIALLFTCTGERESVLPNAGQLLIAKTLCHIDLGAITYDHIFRTV